MYKYAKINGEFSGHIVSEGFKSGGDPIFYPVANYPAFVFCSGNKDEFISDATNLGLQICICASAVFAVDPPHISCVNFADLDSRSTPDQKEEFEGPLPEVREYEFPVVYQMFARQKIVATNLCEAVQKLIEAPLPENGHYVDDSFEIDDESVVKVN